jgi:hypothetical protein
MTIIVRAVRRVRRPGRIATLAIGITIGGLVAGGAALAAIPDSSGVVHGCVNKLTGVARIIDTAKTGPLGTCIKDGLLAETAVSWSQTGPQGPIGLTGGQGPAGPQGNTGAPGANGANGAQGPAGPANLSALEGTPCNVGIIPGTVHVATDATTGAVTITCRESVSGPIATIAADSNSFAIGSITVGVDANTSYGGLGAPKSLADFKVGDCVVASVTKLPDGSLLAVSVLRQACP